MKYKSLILQLLTLFFIFSLTISYKSILLLSITIDSIFSAMGFMYILFIKNLSQSQVLNKIKKIYKISLIDRYLYYLFLEITYYNLCILFWQVQMIPVYYIFLLTICPKILNYLRNNYFKRVFDRINNEKIKFIKIIISKQLTYILNNLSEICINQNPKIEDDEIMQLLEDYDKMIDSFLLFIKNFLITSLLIYTKHNANPIYSKLIFFFYNYKTGEFIESIDVNKAKKKFKNVIVNKEWKNLFKPDTLQTIFYLYSLENNKNNIINYYLIEFNYRVLKMFSIWTLISFLKNFYLGFILSVIFLIYKKTASINISILILEIFFRIVGLVVGYKLDNYLLSSFIFEFGYIIIFNKIVQVIKNYSLIKIQKFLFICFHYNKYDIYLITLYINHLLTSYFMENFLCYDLVYFQILLHYSFILINIDNLFKRITFISTFTLGFLSEYHYLHLLYCIFIFYLVINIIDYNKKYLSHFDIKTGKLKIDLIESYYRSQRRDDRITIMNKVINRNQDINK